MMSQELWSLATAHYQSIRDTQIVEFKPDTTQKTLREEFHQILMGLYGVMTTLSPHVSFGAFLHGEIDRYHRRPGVNEGDAHFEQVHVYRDMIRKGTATLNKKENLLGLMRLAAAYACDAVKLEETGANDDAHKLLHKAWYHHDHCLAVCRADYSSASVSTNASKAANARHAEARANKQKIYLWCDEHVELNTRTNHAAEQVIKVVAVEYDTALKHIREWRRAHCRQKN